MSTLFVWEDTRIGSGTRFGGTLCCIASTADEARGKIREAFTSDPTLSGFKDMHETISTDGTCVWDWLEGDLAKTPTTKTVLLAFGGDY